MKKPLQDKVVQITGASRGIGEATARLLASRGARTVLLARDSSRLESISRNINDAGDTATWHRVDVSAFDQINAAVDATMSQYGRLDILVNNAGVIDPISMIADSSPKAWSEAIDINIKGVYFGIRAVVPHMSAQQSGVIINVGSGAADSVLDGWSQYCASKSAVRKLTECAHHELEGLGIRVIGLSPGTVATEMMARIRDSGINPVSRLDWQSHRSPESVAQAIAYLAGPDGWKHAGSEFSLKRPENCALAGLPE